MTIARTDKPSDSTWQRAWEVADDAELATLLATYLTPLGPKRGDIIVQLDEGIYYIVVAANVVKPLDPIPSENLKGTWVDVPYDAGDYTGDGTLVWTVGAGDVTDFAYTFLNDSTVALNLRIEGTDISGTGTALIVELPAAITPAKDFAGICFVVEGGGVSSIGFYSVSAASPFISFFLTTFGNWATGASAAVYPSTFVYEI